MGHVDHGKTSLLDYIRKTKVASGEAGGITQHIGAYHVEIPQGRITFLDTPGHAAFTAMRARGAQATDIVVLVVAADDGVMPQTEEAIQHAKAAGTPIIVAVNKIDKEGADPERVKNELASKDVIPDDWGGDTQFVNVSALTGQGVDALLNAIILQAELMELTAVPDGPGRGVVIESRLDRGRGPVVTVLVQNGTLKQGKVLIAGEHIGRVRAMINDRGEQITEAGPSMPVEVLGLSGTPDAGDPFSVAPDERKARELADFRQTRSTEQRLALHQASKIENMFATMQEGEKAVLRLVLKTDVRGSLEAIMHAIHELGTDEVKAVIIGSGVGGISESDAMLALTSRATIFGFNVRADAGAKKIIEREGLDVRYYSVIYELLDDVKQVLSGMLAPEIREEILGLAEVRDVFRSPRYGQVAGCMVVSGTVYRNKKVRVLRDNVVIHQGELDSLRRFKDDVSEVRSGLECGIGVKNYDVKVGDKIEVYDSKEVARAL
jgi:translation initiation factor IF-2